MELSIQRVLWQERFSKVCWNQKDCNDFLLQRYFKENLQEVSRIIQDTVVDSGSETFRFDDLGVAMLLNCLPEAFHSTRAILEQSTAALTMKSVSAALLAEDERIRTRDAADGFAAVASRTSPVPPKCPHGRRKTACWTCDPSLHPTKMTCKDCKSNGHRSKNSPRCPKFEAVGTAAAGFSTDVETWSP